MKKFRSKIKFFKLLNKIKIKIKANPIIQDNFKKDVCNGYEYN